MSNRALCVWCGLITLAVALCGCDAAVPDPPQPATTAAPKTAPLALTPTEYNNTIADLLGFPREGERWPARPPVADRISPEQRAVRGIFGSETLTEPPWPRRFPDEPGAGGFEGIVQGQEPSPYQIEALHSAALHFASYALVSPFFFKCRGWETLPDEAQAACAWESIERFAQRAWRRPMDDAERGRLRAFWRANDDAGPRDEAVALSVAGILQAPGFVYRVEHGEPVADDVAIAPPGRWEMASRLSYFLWDSMPDEALFAAAQSGELSTAAGIERQARRMLEDDKARGAVVRFHHQWLGTDKILGISPARRAFGPLFGLSPEPPLDTTGDAAWPSILSPVRYSMQFETELFIERAIFDGEGTFRSLMTDNQGFMSDLSAPIYGEDARRLDGPVITHTVSLVAASLGSTTRIELYPAEFPSDQRSGVLTLPSVLALGAYAVQPGPILRGERVLERLMCVGLGSPPPGAEASLPPDTLENDATNRQRTEAATSAQPCKGCHDQLNPPGFAFEHYDAMGRWRAQDNGQDIDASGSLTLPGDAAIPFSDGIELTEALASSERVRDCYALRWTRYAIGNQIEPDEEGLAVILEGFRSDDSIKELLVTIATSDLFRFRRKEVTP